MKTKLEKQINSAIKNGQEAMEARIGNVNAITTATVMLPAKFNGQKVCTLPKELGKWMKQNKLAKVTVNEYGFKSNYELGNDGWAHEKFN